MIQFTRTEQHPHLSLDDCVGMLPHFWSADDPRDAITQHNAKPAPGGPWTTKSNPKWRWSNDDHGLRYPGDPAMFPLAYAVLPLSSEVIFVYPSAWVAIVRAKPGTEEHELVSVDRRD